MGQSSIRRESYLSYDLRVIPKNEREKKGEGREEEREGGERQRSVRTALFVVATVLIKDVWETLVSCLAEHGFPGKPQENDPGPFGPQMLPTPECGVLECVSVSF